MIIEKGQSFEHSEALLAEENRQEAVLLMEEVIYPWVSSLHKNPGVIVDLAAGQGVEAHLLTRDGYKCVAVDLSHLLTSNSFHDINVRATSASLPFKDDSVSGVLMKDAWIFLPPHLQKATLSEVRRVLEPSGSFLIISELGEAMRMYSVPDGQRYSLKDSFGDDADWEEEAEQRRRDSTIVSIEFISTPDRVRTLAESHFFNFDLVRQYKFNDPLSLENRWIKRKSGFVAKLTKNSSP